MTSNDFDVIVLGAGAAGVCCAAELVLAGARPLLVAESRDVGYQFRSPTVGESRVVVQLPTRNFAGEGGWWFSLARKLNLPVKYRRAFDGVAIKMQGSDQITELPFTPSAAGLADVIAAMAPIDLGASRANLQQVLQACLAVPPAQFPDMQDVLLADWLTKVGADELVRGLCFSLGATLTYLDMTQAAEHLSVFGFLMPLRSYLCGDAEMCSIEPDAREGLLIPMAREVEQRGGSVWRGRRISQVLTESDRAVGVVMDDGTVATAPVVALASHVGRMKSLLDPLPPEVSRALEFESTLGDASEYTTFAVARGLEDRHPRRIIATVAPDGSQAIVNWNISSFAPWITEPGTHVIGAEVVRSQAAVEANGGVGALHAEMAELTEEVYPGFAESVVHQASQQHPQLITPFLVGGKLPRISEAISGLWYVGEGSQPVAGSFVEGAASAGILGARAIAEVLKR